MWRMRAGTRQLGTTKTFFAPTRASISFFGNLGVGENTPGIIKYLFWRITYQNPGALFACINLSEAFCPREIREQAICIDGDIGWELKKLP